MGIGQPLEDLAAGLERQLKVRQSSLVQTRQVREKIAEESSAKERVEEILATYEHTLPEDKEDDLDRILEDARQYYKRQGLI